MVDGAGRTALLLGEAGIGKSRLVEELALRVLPSGLRFLRGGCALSGGGYYRPFVEGGRAYLHESGRLDLGAERALIGADGPELVRLLPELAGRHLGKRFDLPPSIGESEDKIRLFDAVARFLARAAESEPLALVLDDLQWADAPTLELISFLARNLRRSPVLLLLLSRDGPGPSATSPDLEPSSC